MAEIFIDIAGWIGAIIFLIAYYHIVVRKWTTDRPIYHWFNILGGALLTINTVYFSAWAAAFINFVWACIAIIGLINTKRIKAKR